MQAADDRDTGLELITRHYTFASTHDEYCAQNVISVSSLLALEVRSPRRERTSVPHLHEWQISA
jgi:hypothetical protein